MAYPHGGGEGLLEGAKPVAGLKPSGPVEGAGYLGSPWWYPVAGQMLVLHALRSRRHCMPGMHCRPGRAHVGGIARPCF